MSYDSYLLLHNNLDVYGGWLSELKDRHAHTTISTHTGPLYKEAAACSTPPVIQSTYMPYIALRCRLDHYMGTA